MATANPKLGYIVPENIRIFFDVQNDVVRLTSNDDDFGPAGLNVTLKKGTAADVAARAALGKHDINAQPDPLSFEGLPGTSRREEMRVQPEFLDWQVGTGVNGPVIHSFADTDAPHLLIAGGAGTGKTPLLASMIEQLLERECRLWLIDHRSENNYFGRFTLHPFRDEARVEKFVDNSYDDPDFLAKSAQLLNEGVAEMDRRFSLLTKTGEKTVQALRAARRTQGVDTSDIEPIVIVIDEASAVFADPYPREPALRSLQSTACAAAIELARKARSAGIHLVLTSQHTNNASVPSAIRTYCARIGFRTGNSLSSRVLIDQDGLEKIRRKGVGVLYQDKKLMPFMALRSEALNDPA